MLRTKLEFRTSKRPIHIGDLALAANEKIEFSDGTLRLIGLFWTLLDGDAPLLLEEPELSLHTAIVKKLPALFYRMQRKRKRQIFVSTHSWEMLQDERDRW